jgi:trehalose 6-phosphate phosphatase
MIYLFSDVGQEALRRFVSRDTLFAFDLDGTLAPIVADPAEIRISKPVRSGLARLSRLAATAVITGRARSDALKHLGFEPRYLVGNHGIEGLPGYPGQEQELRTTVEQWEGQLLTLLPPEIKAAILLERKGFSLSLHYRHAHDPRAVHAALLAAIDRLLPPPRRVGGKFVENLIPREAPHKGDALLRLMELSGSPRAFFLGDDETDEDVFRLDSPCILPVCVGIERPTAAQYHLKEQSETARLLEEILTILASLP